MLITEMGGKMKKLLLGAMMAALFVSGDAEGLFKKSFKKQAQQATLKKQDVFVEQNALSSAYYTHLGNIQTMLRGHISVIGKQETQSDSNVKDLKSLLQANSNLIAKVISTGQQSQKKQVNFTKISKNIQNLEADVISQLDFFSERLESFVRSPFIKGNYKKWTDDFDGMIVDLERAMPADSTKFLLNDYYVALYKFVSAWDNKIFNAYRYESEISKYIKRAQTLSSERKYGYGVPVNGQVSTNIRTGANQYNDMIRRNRSSSPLQYNNEYSGSTALVPYDPVKAQASQARYNSKIPVAPPQPVYNKETGQFMSQEGYNALQMERNAQRTYSTGIPTPPPRPLMSWEIEKKNN